MPTIRGWACIGAAGALLGAGAALRIPELLEIGVALLALVVIQLTRMHIRRTDYAVRRTVHPPKGMAGAPVTIEVALTTSRTRREQLLYTDPVPQAFGGVRRFPLVSRPGRSTLRYDVTPARRGRYVIGPGRLSSTDPFGVVRTAEAAGAPSELVVFPRVEQLTGRTPAGTRSSGTSTASSASLASGSEFFATREWRPGDDMRRIHWRSTARMGRVMVRQEELPKLDRATIVLDNRRTSYPEGWDGADAFERAVEASASLVHHFLTEGFGVRLVTATGLGGGTRGAPFGKGPAHHNMLMTALATASLADAGAPIHHLGGAGMDGGFLAVVAGVEEAVHDGRLAPLLDGAILQAQDALVVLTTAATHPEIGRALRVLHLPRGETLAAAWHRARRGWVPGGAGPRRRAHIR